MLAASLLALVPGACLIAETPDYGEPRQTAPIVDPKTITPSPLRLLPINLADPSPVQLSLQVRSEDAGESIWASLFVDYFERESSTTDAGVASPAREVWMIDRPFAAQPFDRPKAVSLGFNSSDPRITPGCHTLTLLITHDSHYDTLEKKPIDGLADQDLARVTWWVMATNANDPTEPVKCPGEQ
jgi:hypothetical protein